MAYYDTFIKSTPTPKEDWINTLQERVKQSFTNSSTVQYDIEEEIGIGTLEFKPILARVTQLVDAKSGQRINDDYRKITFSDFNHKPLVGTRYRFDNNIWIAFSTDNIKTVTSALYVRRCNNVMSTQDNYGNIHREPIYIDYKVTENQLYRNYSIDVPNGRIYIQCQLNKYTQNININDRFIFGGDAYRIRERSTFDRRYTFEKDSSYTVSYYAEYDNIGEFDNLELEIANYKEYNYSIESNSVIQNKVGFKNKMIATVYLDKEKVDEPIIWKSTDESVAIIDSNTGEYEFVGVGNCQFICSMINKPDVTFTTEISVVAKLEEQYEDIISPEVNVVKLNNTVVYTIYEYLNGVQTDTAFYIQAFDVPNRNYRLTILNSNSFSVTNLKTYDIPLRIICTNSKRKDENGEPIKDVIYIRLGGIV